MGDEPFARWKDALAEAMNGVADRLELRKRAGRARPIGVLYKEFDGEIFPTPTAKSVTGSRKGSMISERKNSRTSLARCEPMRSRLAKHI